MRVLVFSTIYPNAADRTFGIFTENRSLALASRPGVEVRVMAPIPAPPFPFSRHPKYRDGASLPEQVVQNGLQVMHPRFRMLPAVSWRTNPERLFHACVGPLQRLRREGFAFDVIDAHFLYPDGVAAVMLGQALDVPVVVTALGSDVTFWPRRALAREAIFAMARQAAGLASVSRSLARDMERLGLPAGKTRVLTNAIDLEVFHRVDREAARARFGVRGPTVVSVGLLIRRKRHENTIRAVAALPGVELLIAGIGPMRKRLERLIRELGVADRVRLLGSVPHRELPELFSAADLSVLASSREGMANVLIESIACETPVVATRVDGTPEVIDDPRVGSLVDCDDIAGLTEAIRARLAQPADRAALRAHAARFGWKPTTDAQIAQFREAIEAHRSGRRRAA